MPTITQPDAISPADVNDGAILAILQALTRGGAGPDGRPTSRAVGDAHAVAHFLATAPDGALVDEQDAEPAKPAAPPQDLTAAPLKGHPTTPPPRIREAPLEGHNDPDAMESQHYEWRESAHPRGQPGNAGEFAPRGSSKPSPKTKPSKPTPPKPAKPKSPTIAEAHELIRQAGIEPTRDTLSNLAKNLAQMTVKDLQEVKKKLGLRAGGNKSALADKISRLATARVNEREHWARQARALGIRPADLHAAMTMRRTVHNESARQLREVVAEAYRQYPSVSKGKRLSRGMPGFRSRDPNAVPGFDVLARRLAGSYPEVLGAHGYSGDTGYDADATDAAEKLFELIEAGPAPLLRRSEAYDQAMDDLLRRKNATGRGAMVPFAREEMATMSEETARALLEAIAHAGTPAELEALAELADDPELDADLLQDVDEDTAPVNHTAAMRVCQWLKRKTDAACANQ
jgi:hypothetical protein